MMTGTRARLVTRLSIAVLLLASATIGAATLSSAAPGREEVEQARERLDSLNRELDLMVEQYNQARLKLQEVQARLADVRGQAQRAQATADRALSSLKADSDLAVEAEAARQEARWTAAELKATAEERQGVVDALAAKQDQIESRVAEARDLYEELDRKYHDALAAQAAAQEAAAGTSVGGAPIPPPPAPNPNVASVL